MDYAASPGEEGASEHAIIALVRTRAPLLLAVVRIDGGGGEPHGRHLPYMAMRSTDFGRTRKNPEPTLVNHGGRVGAAWLLRLDNGALLLSGRPAGARGVAGSVRS